VGFFFEAVGDLQLARFKADPENRGKVLRSGLWGWTRHPNYFGDATLWWGYFFFALAVPGGFWTLPSVLLMSLFLLKVSGVALLEKTIADRRPEYRDYVESTPAFFPRLPRRSRDDGGGGS
jgi:steroid 5-alpha reductase family enzyme